MALAVILVGREGAESPLGEQQGRTALFFRKWHQTAHLVQPYQHSLVKEWVRYGRKPGAR